MNITYKNSGYTYSIESIMSFLSDTDSSFWSDTILYFYPQIDKQKLAGLDRPNKSKYTSDALSETYENLKGEIDRKVVCYNAHFENHKTQIDAALSDAFDLDAASIFNDLTGNVTLNPICPRYLKEHRFDVFYMNSERGALGSSLHEVIHYFWFHVWNGHFGDSYDEYESPSLKWILSEMVVEAVMSDARLSSINPYFPRENGGCIYPYFQDMIINGSPILDTMSALYRQNGITDFMEASHAYCIKFENEIQRHIKARENTV